jgi:hypothetical protein
MFKKILSKRIAGAAGKSNRPADYFVSAKRLNHNGLTLCDKKKSFSSQIRTDKGQDDHRWNYFDRL